MGHQIAKHVYSPAWVLEKSIYYVLDAQGNQLIMYELNVTGSKGLFKYYLKERNIYGSQRLGTTGDKFNMVLTNTLPSYGFAGNRSYEFTNLPITIGIGNVLTSISDLVFLRVVREVTRHQLLKRLNGQFLKQYAGEAGLEAGKETVRDLITKKGGGENNPQGPIDVWTSHDNFTDKQIKQTLMQFGPGSVYHAFSLEINYPDWEVEYWFKGYMFNGDSVITFKPIERRMMAENGE